LSQSHGDTFAELAVVKNAGFAVRREKDVYSAEAIVSDDMKFAQKFSAILGVGRQTRVSWMKRSTSHQLPGWVLASILGVVRRRH